MTPQSSKSTLKSKNRVTNKSSNYRKTQSSRKSFWIVLYALWVVLILLSQVPFIAENYFGTDDMEDTYEYHLTFQNDGKTGHYFVERHDDIKTGHIYVKYTTKSNSLEVRCTNIKVLRIYCREMYEDKSQEVLKKDPELDSNYYKTYFINRDYFHVHVYTDLAISELSFIDTPIPYNVLVNSQEWWLTGTNYTYKDDGIILTKVPQGHNYVDIYFKSKDLESPIAHFTTSKTLLGIGEDITFNASASFDPDGQIVSYQWDLGDGTYKIGVTIQHFYSAPGNYQVILTVRDNDHNLDRAYEDITAVNRVMSISKDVDKPVATPGSILKYTLNLKMNTSWQEGLRDIVVTDTLSDNLEYVEASPLPELEGKTLIWNLGTVFDASELPNIILQVNIDKNVVNSTIISNYATLNYKSINYQLFPEEQSNSVSVKVDTETVLAPIIKKLVPDVKLMEDDPPFHLLLTQYEYDFHDFGTNLRWHITDENESLYIISGENSDNDVITITPLPNAFGDSLVTLCLVDSEGYTASQPLWINITPVNDNPVFSTAPDLIVHYDIPYTFNYESYISDIDTPKEDLRLFTSLKTDDFDVEGTTTGVNTGDEQYEYIQVDGFKVTYNFPEKFVDEQVFVSLVVFDGNGTDGDTILINITDDYTPVLTKELPDIILNEGETKLNVFDLDDYFDDPDGDSLFYSFGETHVIVLIHENHSVDISSSTDWFGTDTITFRARDPVGALAEDSILITVIPINDPPVISGVPETFIIHHSADYSFDLTPYIVDKDNETSELFLILRDPYIRTNPLNHLMIIMNYPRTMVGLEIPVTLTVSDGLSRSSQPITIKVTNNWPPEVRIELPDVSFNEDEVILNVFNLDNYFSDKDSDTLYYTYGQKFVNVTINSNNSVDFSAAKNWYGVETVTFRATDPTYAFVEKVIVVTVTPVNDPPVLQSLPTQQLMVKEIFKFDLTDFINDVDNNITELTITTASAQLDVLISGRKLVIYSDKPVTDIVRITVSDGYSEVTETMLVEIQEETPKAPPSLGFIVSLLWLLIFVIIIIISVTGHTAYRKYMGNYNIEEIFWIYDNGLLISHITSRMTKRKADTEIVSGMLTAILDFSEDAFTEIGEDKKGSRIKEIQMDEKNILVERGKYTFLATVFTGVSGKRLYKKSSEIMKTIESKYANELKSWSGDSQELTGGQLVIRSKFLPIRSTRPKKNKNKKQK